MKTNKRMTIFTAALALVFAMLACNAPGASTPDTPTEANSAAQPSSTAPAATAAANPLPTFAPDTPTPVLQHLVTPGTNVEIKKHVFDVVSIDTASDKRAPYGDSYKLNRFERPFLQDMTYVSDLDIASYSFGEDTNFFYVSIELIGTDPNNQLGINYGVEIDTNADGFGDYIIWAHPPYSIEWTTDNVQVFKDTNHDTGGLSAEKSDAPLPGDGYDKLIFNGGRGDGDDPDLAWIRVNAGRLSTVQFAFKKSLAGSRFMYGVLADAGLKDVGKMDYVDRFTEAEAGSPEKSEKYYPLKALYAVDNVCRETYGFTGNGEEPQRCPIDLKPEPRTPRECAKPPSCYVWDSSTCTCLQ
jgi:hypothetical protein